MATLLWIIGATVVDSLMGLAGIVSLWMRPDTLNRFIKFFIAFSAGVLIGGAFFHLLVESLSLLSPNLTFLTTVIGFLLFFVFEEYLHWHLCEECEIHPYSYLMIVGDSIHNIIDGLVIAGAFIVSVPLGVVTTIMILGHEIPQELGVFAILVSGGIKNTKAIAYSFFAQCSCVLGGIIGFMFMQRITVLSSFLLPFAAGGFIYIAASDLIPGMHKTEGFGKVTSFIWLCLGIAFMIAAKALFGA
ncbi:MAG: ZIP family metal transporter [Candidatus Saganbacteria bacterium]|nr:ZIP family metal transporter [Candidatus Saganbacteria bacterium]